MAISNSTTYKVTKADPSSRDRLLGVITTRGTDYNDNNLNDFDPNSKSKGGDPFYADVGMLGQVWVKTSLENGTVKPGDPLTISSTAGIAMKASTAGRIIGYALKPWDGSQSPDTDGPKVKLPSGVGMILTRVQVDWYDPQKEINNAGNTLNNILLYPDSTIDNINHYGLSDKNGLKIDNSAAFSDSTIANLTAGNIKVESIDAKSLNVDKIKANQIEGLEVITDKITTITEKLNQLEGLVASTTATLTPTSVPGASPSAQLTQVPLTLGDFVFDNGQANLDLKVLGTLEVEKALVIGGKAQFKEETIFEKLVTFIGNIIFKGDISFEGRPTFNKDTAGFALIKKGERKVDVVFEKEYAQSPVVTVNAIWEVDKDTLDIATKTPQYFLAKPEFVIANLTTKGFSIITDVPTVSDLKLSWVAIAVKDAKTFESSGSSTLINQNTSSTASTISISLTPTISVAISTTPSPNPSSTPTLPPSPTPSISVVPTPTQIITPSSSTQTSSLPSPIPGPSVTILPNDLGFVRMRDGPGSDAAEIGQIPSGTKVSYSDVQFDWYKITYNGKTGWVSGTYVTK